MIYLSSVIRCQEVGCQRELVTRSERENRLCLRCEQKLIDHANERREWHYYHPEGR